MQRSTSSTARRVRADPVPRPQPVLLGLVGREAQLDAGARARRRSARAARAAVSATRRCVRTVAGLSRARPPPAATSSTAPARPPSASHTNVSRLPAGPGRPDGAKPSTDAPRSRARAATATIAARRSAGSRTTPPLPTRSRPTSNCGLTIARQSNALGGAGQHRRQHLRQRDERDVDRRSGRARTGSASASSARAFMRSMTVTRSSLRSRQSQLAVGDVERDHVRRAALQQAVGEAAGRGADVERRGARRRRAEGVERVGELDAPARDVRRRRVDRELDVGVDELARLLRARARPARACTSPASTAAAARERDANRPRSASRLSRRTRGTAQQGNGAMVIHCTVRSAGAAGPCRCHVATPLTPRARPARAARRAPAHRRAARARPRPVRASLASMAAGAVIAGLALART